MSAVVEKRGQYMFCSNCGKEIKDGSKFCDGCGASVEGGADNASLRSEQPKKKMHGCLKAFLIFIGISFVFGIIGSLHDSSGQSQTPVSTNTVQKKADLELVESSFCQLDYGVKGVCGTIKNNSDKTYSYAQVSINLYDASENLIGSTLANINNLAPQKQWKFQAIISEDNPASYKVEDITGF